MASPETCSEVITGSDAKEMIDTGWKHIHEAHPEIEQRIMANPKEENDKWMAEFAEKFPNLQDA